MKGIAIYFYFFAFLCALFACTKVLLKIAFCIFFVGGGARAPAGPPQVLDVRGPNLRA